MMSTELKIFLELLRAGILGERPDLGAIGVPEEQWDVKEIARSALRHEVVLTVYAALDGTESMALQQLKQALRVRYGKSLTKSVNQDCEGQVLLDALEQAGVDCIPLKGWVLRDYYADPLSRSMTDLDILVRDYRYEQIRGILEPLGYTGEGGGSWKHDDFRKPPYLHIEMHKRLTDNSGAVRAWEADVWKRASLREGTEHQYLMAPEDFYVFHLVHMYKDFKNGALGFRRLADLWILRRNMDARALAAAAETMKGFHMDLFAQRMEQLASVCFEHAEEDENSQILLRFAASGAVYADDERYKLGRMAAQGASSAGAAKLRSLLAALFLPYERMKAQYPAVERWPVLLPWFWAKRIVHYARHPRKKLQRLDSRSISEGEYEQMRRVFRAGGMLTEENGKTETV